MADKPDSTKSLVEYMRKHGVTGSKGMYTPEQLASVEPEDIARVLNNLVSRVNFDYERETRRNARFTAAGLILLGLVVGSVSMYVLISLWFNPIARLVEVLKPH